MRYPIKFPKNSNLWNSSNNCSFCKTIDKTFLELFKDLDINSENYQTKLAYIDEGYLVDGYNLLLTYEKNTGKDLFNNISQLKTYKSISEAFINEVNRQYFPDKFNNSIVGNPWEPTLIHGRWCRNCGSMKPFIYDSEREIK